MTLDLLYRTENLIFVSKHDGVIGSLYFFAREGADVYRGRIRLNHAEGPRVSSLRGPVAQWLLVSEACFAAYTAAATDQAAYAALAGGLVFGDLVENVENAISNAEGQTICEIYGHTHQSRGTLKLLPSTLTQEQVDLIRATINSVPCHHNSPPAVIDAANAAIIALLNGPDFPAWMRQ